MPSLLDTWMAIEQFKVGVAKGVGNAIVSTVDGLWTLTKNGAKLATDPAYREQTWETTKALADEAKAYGTAAYNDPAAAWSDAKSVAGNAWTAAEQFAATASPEDWGELVGNVGVNVIPGGAVLTKAGAVAKLGKAGTLTKAVKVADELASPAALKALGKPLLLSGPKPLLMLPAPSQAGAAIAKGAEEAAEVLPKAPPLSKAPCVVSHADVAAKARKALGLRDDLPDKYIGKNGEIDWPPNKGWAYTPISDNLQPGTILSRYSAKPPDHDTGLNFSPTDVPFAQRSLPFKPEARYLTEYEVLRELPVQKGHAAPWFDEPGYGEQLLPDIGKIPGVPEDKVIDYLIQNGYLKVRSVIPPQPAAP